MLSRARRRRSISPERDAPRSVETLPFVQHDEPGVRLTALRAEPYNTSDMFDALTEKLNAAFRRLGSHGTVSEKDLDEAMREVRLALLEADVNFKVARQFIADVRERALGAKVLESLTPVQQIIGIVRDELVAILGGENAALAKASAPPTVIMLAGLKGSGKTTTAAKLALHLRKKGEKPALIAADPYRVAGGAQLASLGRQLDLPVYGLDGVMDAAVAAKRGLAEAKKAGATTVIIDTAGRSQDDEAMMAEVAAIRDGVGPDETLLVVDAMTGQEAVNAAAEFDKALGLTGFILTKFDGDARGGAALSIRSVTGLPVKFVGNGEKVDALEPFYPDRIASRILGMGDVLSLVEKAQESIGEGDIQRLKSKIKSQKFDMQDFLEQYQSIRKMGSLSSLVGMIPGLSMLKGRAKMDSIDDSSLARVEAMILSMTREERRNPQMIDGSRRRRIARGSGTTPQDVNQLLNQFREVQKLMKMMSSGGFPGTPRLKMPGLGR